MIVSIIVFVSYVAFIWGKYGVLPSISHSYYYHHKGWLFTLFMWAVALPVVFIAEDGFMFFAGSFLAFCGAAPAFKGKSIQSTVHSVGAEGGILLAFVSLSFLHGAWPLAAIMVVFTTLAMLFRMRNHTWWIEICAFVLILIGLLFYYK